MDPTPTFHDGTIDSPLNDQIYSKHLIYINLNNKYHKSPRKINVDRFL